MDKNRKKKVGKRCREEQRATARAVFPIAAPELRALFDMLDFELPQQGCDHTRRLSQRWLSEHGHDVMSVFEWCDSHGGYCDCEILANVEEHVDDALRDQ